MATAKKKSNNTARKRAEAKKKPVVFDYIKGNNHRVIYASGAHGGPNPSADKIVMSLFNERFPIPKQETYNVDEKGRLDASYVKRIGRKDIIREVEATIVFDIRTAKLIHDWLAEQIEKVEAITHAK